MERSRHRQMALVPHEDLSPANGMAPGPIAKGRQRVHECERVSLLQESEVRVHGRVSFPDLGGRVEPCRNIPSWVLPLPQILCFAGAGVCQRGGFSFARERQGFVSPGAP